MSTSERSADSAVELADPALANVADCEPLAPESAQRRAANLDREMLAGARIRICVPRRALTPGRRRATR